MEPETELKIETLEELIEHLEREAEEAKRFIVERAKDNNETELSDDDMEELFNIDGTGYIFMTYDMEDMGNHNFDLGIYKGLTYSIEKLKQLNNK